MAAKATTPAIELAVGERTIRLSNPDRVYFPEGIGVFQLEFTGSPFHNYVVQGSSNLLTWVDLGLATTNQIGGSDSAFLFRHSQAPPAAPQFFYRLRLP